jgi:hypothetical protein
MRAVIMFTGFQESEERQSGFEKGYFSVVRHFASPEITTYHPRTWKTNVDHLLRQLYENGISEVAIICYSHGQAAAMEFARKAVNYGVTVKLLLACDPVYRPSWLPRALWSQALSFRAIIGNPVIKVPPTVRHVYSVVQSISKPSGHEFVADVPGETIIHIPIRIFLPHTRIDESPVWWKMVKDHLTEFVK